MNTVIPIGILTGPTATGKSGLAIELALELGNLEIINADSMLVYRGMNIGTAKPTLQEQQGIPHHLIDILDPNQPFTAGEFKRAAEAALQDIHDRGKRALIVGGTGFYLKALLFGLWNAPPADPELREALGQRTPEELHQELLRRDEASALRIGVQDRYRLIRALELIHLTGKSPSELQAEVPPEPDPRFTLWVVDRSNEELYSRIHTRTEQMLRDGFVDEVRNIQAQFPGCRALQSVGYAQVVDSLAGRLPSGRKLKPGIEGMQSEIELGTRQLVKSQRTWFRNQLNLPQLSQRASAFTLDADRPKLELAIKSIYS